MLGFKPEQSVHDTTIKQHLEEHAVTFSSGNFTIDGIGFIQTADTRLLAAVARGELDLNRIAREELAARDLDQNRGLGRP